LELEEAFSHTHISKHSVFSSSLRSHLPVHRHWYWGWMADLVGV